MGMERELRRAVRSLEQRLQGIEESIEGLAGGQQEQGRNVRQQHSRGDRKNEPFSPWAGK